MGIFDSQDPFTQVEAFLWDAFEADTAWTSLVKAANRLKRTGTARSIQRPGRLTGDLPEVDLVPAGFEFAERTSSSWILRQAFSLIINSGDLRPSQAVFPVRWNTLRVLRGLGGPTGDGRYTGKSWLRRVWPADGEDEAIGSERTPAGWQSVMMINSEMYILLTELV